MSPADSITVFVVVLAIICIVALVIMFGRTRGSSAGKSATKPSVGERASIAGGDSSVMERLDPAGSNSKGGDPRGVDIGGN
jgi:hypothetical protein